MSKSDYKIKYLKYKKKYLDLKGNGPNLQVGDKLISYYNPGDGRHIFNVVEINAVRNLLDGSRFYEVKTQSGKTVKFSSSLENDTWIRNNDTLGFYRNQDPNVQEVWKNHGKNPNKSRQQSTPASSPPSQQQQISSTTNQPIQQQRSSTTNPPSVINMSISSTNRTNDIKVNINLPIIMNQGILERVNICLNNGGKIDHSHHLTLYSGTTDNYNDLKIITTNSISIKNLFFRECPTYVNTGTGGYKILGQHLSDGIKRIINFDDRYNLNNLIDSYGSENNRDKGVFLAKVFFGNNVDFTSVYEKIKEGTSNLDDTKLYTRDNYDNFTLHLSLAKFDNVKQALIALNEIYQSRLPPGFDDYFNIESNFAKYLNISIN
tara:strand:+ start:275 stop:1402 length:1128 start_codon:yes stop_codon:yes gene_type:complete